ncbi:MAG: glycoside hydrolase family 88 protein [Prevotellaceae bacterium]|jgi:unsaturated chondroitin disaccharide hydrolase|nr:glycoside hydrolase family 88 protein [Prevotellaceae bacterium]
MLNLKSKPVLALCPFLFALSIACSSEKVRFDVSGQLGYCHSQALKTLQQLPADTCLLPRSISGEACAAWALSGIYDWTSGFFPGILWYDYENSGSDTILSAALRFTRCLAPLGNPASWGDHDIGFQMLCSFGNALRITGDKAYEEMLLGGAEKLARLYNPAVGTTLSWPGMVQKMNWPHNTIMDNMMNLEILFWAAKNGGSKAYYDMAVSHAVKTMENHFRADYSCYHVAVYDTATGDFIKGVTNQGYSDESMWARGQAWAIYGYTMVYRETQDKKFLRFVEKVVDIYARRLPDDLVPYWDFDDPAIPNAPRDASSAAIVASALLELSQLEDDRKMAKSYRSLAEQMLISLSENYQSRDANPAFLRHSTGNLPAGYEIGCSISYADYYYIEALMRYKNWGF